MTGYVTSYINPASVCAGFMVFDKSTIPISNIVLGIVFTTAYASILIGQDYSLTEQFVKHENKIQVSVWLTPSEVAKLDRKCKGYKSRSAFISTLIANL